MNCGIVPIGNLLLGWLLFLRVCHASQTPALPYPTVLRPQFSPTASSFWALPLQPWVQGVAQTIAKPVEGPPRQEDDLPGANDSPYDEIAEYQVHVERNAW